MYCRNCGTEVSDDCNFCPKCGLKMKQDRNIKTIRLICEECNGTLMVEEGKNILSCPYCGAKRLVMDSDRVAVQRIKSQAYRDVELKKQETYKEVEMRKFDIEQRSELYQNILLIAGIIFILVPMMGMYFGTNTGGEGLFIIIGIVLIRRSKKQKNNNDKRNNKSR